MADNHKEKNLTLLSKLAVVKNYKRIKNDFDLAKALNMSSSYLYEILSGSKNVPKTMGQKLEDNLNISRRWFELDQGRIYLHETEEDKIIFNLLRDSIPGIEGNYKNNEVHSRVVLAEPVTEYNIDLVKGISVPIYNVEFDAGVLATLIENKDDHYPVGYLGIPEVQGCDAVIRVKGDGMSGRINDRDWVGIKRIVDWKEWVPLGYIYAITTDNFELVRYLEEGSSDESFTIVSHNKAYKDQEIPKKLIRDVWSVKAILPFGKIETLI